MNDAEVFLIGSTAFIAVVSGLLMTVGQWLYRSLLREEREQAQREKMAQDHDGSVSGR